MAPSRSRRYRSPMRLNMLLFALVALAAAGLDVFKRDYPTAIFFGVLAVVCVVVHFVRVRRFKRFDEAKKFD